MLTNSYLIYDMPFIAEMLTIFSCAAVHFLMLAAAIVGSVIDAKDHPVLPVSGSRS